MAGFLAKLLSFGADKDIKEYQRITARVGEFEPRVHALDDAELAHQTVLFRERYANGESLDDLLPEAFATVREASIRTLGMRHFDVQIVGGIALHRGTIAEMKTGEGKTLVATLAAYLNAIPGEGVHIVTVNDYLAKRDSEWMGLIYRFLGMEVGLLQNGMRPNLKVPAYAADITYGTNSEFGFDYLRDNMVMRAAGRVQRGHHYAIVDEVDSILIDEARTPLIISGAGNKSATTYKDFARAVRGLIPDVDFEMDEAKHTIAATDQGLRKIERALGVDDIYADDSGQMVNHLQQALKAQYMFHRDQQYVVDRGEVKIVDEFTGRIMEGRRYSEGLHQAIEAKEGVYVREENQTLATITLQNYFRLYEKLSGMTGTAMTEDAEFREIYNLPVEVIPSNKPLARVDHDDLVYRTIRAKFNAVADDVAERHAAGQPCLVGTVSIENSERLARIFEKRGLRANVLNAKHHAREAEIVAQAGRFGAVTIATNMAGRGTDILLGGNASYLALDILREHGVNVEGVTAEQLSSVAGKAKLDLSSATEAELVRLIDESCEGSIPTEGLADLVAEAAFADKDLKYDVEVGDVDLSVERGPRGITVHIPSDGEIDCAKLLGGLDAAGVSVAPNMRLKLQRAFEQLNSERAKLPEQAAYALERARRICADEHDKVIAAGGLCVIGTERHESRRIDNQLRGRSGRQGDPGETQFYLSLEDDLMRLFGGDRMDRVAALMERYEMPDDMPIQHKMVTKAVESAQRKVEEINFAMRKNVLDYDDVMNKQRQVIYEERNKILDGKDLTERVAEVTYDTVQRRVAEFCPEAVDVEQWDYEGLEKWVVSLTGRHDCPELPEDADQGDLIDIVNGFVSQCYDEKAARYGEQIMHEFTSQTMLRVISTRWMSYLQEMDYLKTGIGLRGFGQRDPLVEYKTEAYAAFSELINTMYEDFLRTILRLELNPALVARATGRTPDDDQEPSELRGAKLSGPAEVDGDRGASAGAVRAAASAPGAASAPKPTADKPRTYRKADLNDPFANVGRNDPCPCGSGKKFKKCHGRNL